MLKFASSPTLHRFDFQYGIVAVVTRRGGYLLHPTGDDGVWDEWANVINTLFGEGWVVDDPYLHPSMDAWLVTVVHQL